MGSGKTTVGGICARRLGRHLIDSDEQIEERFGIDGREMAERSGVERLHAEEATALRTALATTSPAVIAAAASVGDDPGLVSVLGDSGAFVVFLEGDHDVLEERAAPGGHRRPREPGEAQAQGTERRRRMVSIAALVVDVTDLLPDEVADRVLVAAADR